MFTFYSDPGHGWLEVAWSDLKRLSLNPTDFSRCSSRKGNLFYVEEDCDAPIFLNAWEAMHGIKPQFREVYQERIFIRNLPSIY